MDFGGKMIMTNWYKNADVSIEEIAHLESRLELKLPSSYKKFLIANGVGEGVQKDAYLSLWSIKDLLTLNNDYQIQNYLGDNFLAFGSDGGGNCFVFNIENDFKIFSCSFGDLDTGELRFISDDFHEMVSFR